jgi:transposase-like protein
MLLAGTPPSTIRDLCRDWGCSPRHALRLIKAARRELVADVEGVEEAEAKAEILSQLAEIQHRAMEASVHAVALGAVNTRARIMGIGEPPAAARQAVAAAMAAVEEAIRDLPLSEDTRFLIRLGLAARGLTGVPSMECLSDDDLDAIAGGDHPALPSSSSPRS